MGVNVNVPQSFPLTRFGLFELDISHLWGESPWVRGGVRTPHTRFHLGVLTFIIIREFCDCLMLCIPPFYICQYQVLGLHICTRLGGRDSGKYLLSLRRVNLFPNHLVAAKIHLAKYTIGQKSHTG